MTARYSVGETRLLARICREKAEKAWDAARRHKAAALAEKTQAERDVRLAYVEAANCTGRHWTKIATFYDRAAEDLEHAREGLP